MRVDEAENTIFDFRNLVWIAFLTLVFSLAFIQPFVSYRHLRLSPTDFLFPLVSLIFLICLLTKKIAFRWHNFYWLLFFYFAAMFFSSVFSINPKQSFIKLAGEGYLLGLAVLTFNLVRTRKDFKQFVAVWLAATFFTLLVGVATIILFYTQPSNPLLSYTTSIYGAVPVGNYPRLTSTFASASMYCNFLNVSLILLYIAEELKYIGAKLFWFMFALTLVCAFFTFSSGLGGIVLAVGVWAWRKLAKENLLGKAILTGSVALAILFFVVNFFALQKYPNAPFAIAIPFVETELLPSPRLLIWIDALETFAENPLTGIGLGQSTNQVSFQNTDGTPAFLTDAHNILLSVAAQNGVFGLLAVAAIMFFLMRKFSLSAFNKSGAVFTKNALALAFICAFFYQGLTGSFEDTRHLWATIGFLLSAEALELTEI